MAVEKILTREEKNCKIGLKSLGCVTENMQQLSAM